MLKKIRKINIIDAVVLLAVVGMLAGYAVRSLAPETRQVLEANATFYVTFEIENVRIYRANAVSVDDVFFQRHVGAALGHVVETWTEDAYDVIQRPDGTAMLMPVEDRYTLYITLEVTGNINETGYYINGNNHVAVGTQMQIRSNRMLSAGFVHRISTVHEPR
jgi:hypothetical protein